MAVWVGRARRYFICSAFSLEEGLPHHRFRWRQLSDEPDALPQRAKLHVPPSKAAELYYEGCGVIDGHNRCWQDELAKLVIWRRPSVLWTPGWRQRVNMTMSGMRIVDAYLLHKGALGERCLDQWDSYSCLADALVAHQFEYAARRLRSAETAVPSGRGVWAGGAFRRVGSSRDANEKKEKDEGRRLQAGCASGEVSGMQDGKHVRAFEFGVVQPLHTESVCSGHPKLPILDLRDTQGQRLLR